MGGEKKKKTLGNRDILKVVPCLVPSLILTFVFHLDFVCFIKVPETGIQTQKKRWILGHTDGVGFPAWHPLHIKD
jgi:hypothetical protein